MQRMLPKQYDIDRALVYLNEEIVDDFNPSEDAEAPIVEGYTYEGNMPDGGTLIICDDVTNRDALVNGIIRSRYSQTQEDAIKTHQLKVLRGDAPNAKIDEYNLEWQEFDEFRGNAISLVDGWLQ